MSDSREARQPTLYTNFRWGFTGELQSMLVDDGRMVWRRAEDRESRVVSRESEIGHGQTESQIPELATRNPQSAMVDLTGKWLMPSFIDNHCHILPTGLDLQKLHLGACDTHEEVLDAVRGRLAQVESGQWLMAVHYDQTRYAGGEHLTRYELDKISSDQPILLRHVNGHASVANSAALKAAGIREDEADFPGGTFRRNASGVVDGVLLEHAHEKVGNAAPRPDLQQMVQAILLAGEKMAAVGIACASDMMTGRFNLRDELEAYILASGTCSVRLRLYVQWGAMFGGRALEKAVFDELVGRMDSDRCRVAGIKIFADGAIGSATAAIYGSYEGAPPAEISGTLMYSRERLHEMIRMAHDAGYQLAIHSIGDHSTDLVMDGLGATGEPQRHRVEHAMILSDAQIERLALLGCYVTMQPEFLIRFSHSYERQLGPERKSRLKRARSVLAAGIPLSLSSDRPIVAGDPMDGIRTVTNRPSGYDPGENISAVDAWLGYTSRAAAANGDADLMGSLLAGQLPDFQILDAPPAGFAAEA